MVRKLGYITGILIGALSALYAGARVQPGQFAVTGEWVYLHPLVDSPYYVINGTAGPAFPKALIGPRNANTLDFHSGFSVEAMYGFTNALDDVRICWTHLVTSDSSTQSGTSLFEIQNYPSTSSGFYSGTATSHIGFTFNAVEGVFGRHLYEMGCLGLTLEGGLNYSRISQRNEIIYSGTFVGTPITDLLKNTSSYWGIGPQVGLEGSYHIWNRLNAVANVSSALLIGQNRTHLLGTALLEPNSANLRNDAIWRVVPAFQVRGGLNYGLGCMWDIEIGYEFLSYIRPLGNIVLEDVLVTALSIDYYTNVDFHGPYAAVSFKF